MSGIIQPSKDLKGRRIIVVGESVAGLSTAIALANAGAHVEVRERADEDAFRTGAFVFRRPTIRALARLAVRPEDGVRLRERIQWQLGWGARARTAPLVDTLTWGAAVRPLRDRFSQFGNRANIERGRTVDHVEDREGKSKPAVVYTDGTREEADLVVIADGAFSKLSQKLTGRKPIFRYGVHRGTIPWDSLTDWQQTAFSETLWEEITEGGVFVAIPVQSERNPGTLELSWSFFTHDNKKQTEEMLHRPINNGVVTSQYLTPEVEERRRKLAYTYFSDTVQSVIENADNQHSMQFVFDPHPDDEPEHHPQPFKGVVRVGMAALPLRPFSARASEISVLDAIDLADALCKASRKGKSITWGLKRFAEKADERRADVYERTRRIDRRIGMMNGEHFRPARAMLRGAGQRVGRGFVNGATSRPAGYLLAVSALWNVFHWTPGIIQGGINSFRDNDLDLKTSQYESDGSKRGSMSVDAWDPNGTLWPLSDGGTFSNIDAQVELDVSSQTARDGSDTVEVISATLQETVFEPTGPLPSVVDKLLVRDELGIVEQESIPGDPTVYENYGSERDVVRFAPSAEQKVGNRRFRVSAVKTDGTEVDIAELNLQDGQLDHGTAVRTNLQRQIGGEELGVTAGLTDFVLGRM